MATIEAAAGNQETAPGKGLQKAKGSGKKSAHGIDGQAGSFMTVLMQLLGQDFSPEEIKKLESLVIGGIKKGKSAEGGKAITAGEVPDDKTGNPALLAAALKLASGQGAEHVSALKTGVPEEAASATALKMDGKTKTQPIDLTGHPELKRVLKLVQGGKAAQEKTAAAAAGAGHPGSEPLTETGKQKALRSAELTEKETQSDAGPAIFKPEKEEITVDLEAFRAMLGRKSGAEAPGTEKAGTVPAAGATAELNASGLTEAVGERIHPLLAGAAASTGGDTFTIRVKDGAIEKKFTVRKSLLAADRAESGAEHSSGEQMASAERIPGRIAPSGATASGDDGDILQGNANRQPVVEHGKFLVREMLKPADHAAGKAGGNEEFSNILVKYVSRGPDGEMEKVFFQEIERPGVEKEMLLIRTETIPEDGLSEASPAVSRASGGSQEMDMDAIEPRSILRQVAEGAEAAFGKDCSRVRMELNPPKLGALDMDLLVSQDRVRMVILTDSPEVQNVLQGNLDQLRSSLEQQGLKMDGIDVFVQDRYAGGSGDPSGHARDGGRPFGNAFTDDSGSRLTQSGPEMEQGQPVRPSGLEGNTGLSIFA